ncbi:MAG: SHOCT domain-containing protein [Myxococcota bacterium]|nr:SHOCT domain-containing protein [Myxococcota bacterium]
MTCRLFSDQVNIGTPSWDLQMTRFPENVARSPVALLAWVMLCLLCLTSATASAAQRSKTIENIPPRPHYAPAETSPEQFVAAIRAAAEGEGWRIVAEAPGVMEAQLLIRSHKAVVTIRYDESHFSINYRDSTNLNYNPKDVVKRGSRWDKSRVVTKGPRIHPNYNVWVAALADRISIRLRKPPEPSRPDPLLVADELDKLDKLRQRGVLTQEEFDRRKAALLSH